MSSNISLTELIKLYQYARVRYTSGKHYFDFQCYQGSLLVRYLTGHNVNLSNKRVLDLGSGIGGYTKAIQEAGAMVIAIDRFTKPFDNHQNSVSADALYLPIKENIIDVVICASLIEHVDNPNALIEEIFRVLHQDGYLYLSFPPYYSPIGGHQFSPYHLLGKRFATRMAIKRGLFKNQPELIQGMDKNDLLSKAGGEWGLFPLTISKVSKILNKFPFNRLDRSTRWIPIDFSGIPYLGEFLTWHVQFLLQKK